MRKWLPFAFLLGLWAFYLTFLAPTLSTPDSPELVAAAFTLGIAHSPGYTLYLLVGKLFSFLPLGSLAWRLNVMSALFAVLTAGLVYLVIGQLWALIQGPSPSPQASRFGGLMASAATLILAISSTFWVFALGAEVYPMNAFLLLLGVLAFLRWRVVVRSLALVSFLSGLLLAFHTANLIYFGSFAFLGIVLLLREGRPRLRWLILTALFFLLGFSVVLYLPVRSASLPLVNFGEIAGIQGFYHTLTGKVYLEDLPYFAIPWTERLFNMRYTFSHINEEFGLLPGLLGIVGLGLLGRRAPFFALFLLFLMGTHVAFWGSSDLGASTRGFFPSHMFMSVYVLYALFIGVGVLGLLSWLERRSFAQRARWLPVTVPLLLLLFPAYSLFQGYRDNNNSQFYQFYQHGDEGLRSLENPSIFFCSNGDNRLFFFWYFTTVEEKWPGVRAVIMDPFFKAPLERILKDPQNREILERLKGKRFQNSRLLRSALIGELVRANDGKLPFYTNILDMYIPNEYARIQRGGVYEIRRNLDFQELVVEAPHMDHPIGVRYGNSLELVGYNLDREALKLGSHLRITYFWRALHDVAADYQAVVLITTEDGRVLHEPFSRSLSHLPIYGVFSTSRWPVGKVLQERHEFLSYRGLRSGRYWINVGVGDKKELLRVTGGRVPIEGRFARIGRFEVLP
ncbi:MAG: DUF2723 domain-containing protein [Candidatus Tectomicrobia bacterium]|uniref:DUF2723 domain-containing protein n=1 Tax=Tectimicrobiota bacterium TaxID=2528274 RepID=A0A932CMH3_UNCTE|nr:DUF2723 domain-containing protein [Candidatus Tectomicrobia bacterium]